MENNEKGNPNYYMTLSKCPVKFTKHSIIAGGKAFDRTKTLYALLTAKKDIFNKGKMAQLLSHLKTKKTI